QLREQLAEADRSVQLHRSERDLHAGAAQRRTDQERQLAAKQEALAQLATESAQLQEQLRRPPEPMTAPGPRSMRLAWRSRSAVTRWTVPGGPWSCITTGPRPGAWASSWPRWRPSSR